jgi:hypothetical protein
MRRKKTMQTPTIRILQAALNPDDRRALAQKLADLAVPGAVVEVDPDEADMLGAFREEALTEEEAYESSADLEG